MMESQKLIQEIVNYIEECIGDKIETGIETNLSADAIAKKAGFSTHYFHRLFNAYTGESLVNYIRSRKLSYAMLDVIAKKRIIDLALKYGYGSERAFSRAFTSYFGKSPSQCRTDSFVLDAPLIVYDIHINEFEGGLNMNYLSNVTFKNISAMRVASKIVESQNPEEEVIAYMQNIMKSHNYPIETEQYGFDSPVNDQQEEQGIRGYEYWFKIEDDFNDDRVIIKTVPGYQYATLRIKDPFENPFEKIPNGWRTLVKWIEENEAHQPKFVDVKCLEQVIELEGVTYMNIMIPIKEI